jgi:hypothetical protein
VAYREVTLEFIAGRNRRMAKWATECNPEIAVRKWRRNPGSLSLMELSPLNVRLQVSHRLLSQRPMCSLSLY